MRSELAFEAGEWDAAEAALPRPARPAMGTTFINDALRRIELALGRGDHDGRARCSTRPRTWPRHARAAVDRPLGALRAELERRAGDFDAARAAIEDALDRLDFCSQDVARMARVAATGVRVEADAAVRARDLGEDPSLAIAMAEGLIARVEACAEGERPVEAAFLGQGAGGAGARRGRRRSGAVAAAAPPGRRSGARTAPPRRSAAAPRRCSAGGDASAAAAAADAWRPRTRSAPLAGLRDRGLRAAGPAATGARTSLRRHPRDRHGCRRRPVRAHAA